MHQAPRIHHGSVDERVHAEAGQGAPPSFPQGNLRLRRDILLSPEETCSPVDLYFSLRPMIKASESSTGAPAESSRMDS